MLDDSPNIIVVDTKVQKPAVSMKKGKYLFDVLCALRPPCTDDTLSVGLIVMRGAFQQTAIVVFYSGANPVVFISVVQNKERIRVKLMKDLEKPGRFDLAIFRVVKQVAKCGVSVEQFLERRNIRGALYDFSCEGQVNSLEGFEWSKCVNIDHWCPVVNGAYACTG